jgi:hypothetical protein
MHSFFSKNMGGVFVKILQIFWGAGRGGGELQRPPTRFNQQDSNLDSQDSSLDSKDLDSQDSDSIESIHIEAQSKASNSIKSV